jgi:hypothetical protein
MPEFNTPIDVANRALQHVGSGRISSFTENNRRAAETGACYGKLRQAELRENVWQFATKRTCIRAIDTNTFNLEATLWSASGTYFAGSIVSDASGTLWISRTQNNINNEPGVADSWEPYFGQMTVQLYDSGTSYFAGELVYTITGNGSYNVYSSKLNGNNVHPALPNQWSISTTYNTSDVVQEFPAWAIGTSYSKGQGVTSGGNIYVSLTNSNLGNTPPSAANWALMPALTLANISTTSGPPSTTPIAEWNQTTAYSQGTFVVFNGVVYLSLSNTNTGNFPNAAGSTSWVLVTNGTLYMSLFDLNVGNDPALAPALWAVGTTYSIGNMVGGSDGRIYTSLTNGNIANDPTLDSGVNWTSAGLLNPWTTVFTQGGGNSLWTQIGGASFPFGVGISKLNLNWPINCGPVSQALTRNVYRLPAGFLRKAPQDPSAGTMSWLGAPGNLAYEDWTYFGNYLVSMDSFPILLRFVADVQDVSTFDPMFCEGLAYRIGLEVCEPLTQSNTKQQTIAQAYKEFMSRAKRTNAINMGSTEAPLDDFIACRI